MCIRDRSYTLLKYQMGMTLTDQIVLTDMVDESNANNLPASISNAVDYAKRIEYSILDTQGELAGLCLLYTSRCV